MRIIPLASPAEPLLDPDLVWDGRVGDIALTAHNDAVNPAGLRSRQALATAVLICLMTDCRADPTELDPGDVNRGWPGDGFDLLPGEKPLGSKLWLLRRRALTAEIELAAVDYAREAMQTLIDQGAFVRVEVTAEASRERNRLEIDVAGYGRDGSRVYQGRFGVIWEQLHGISDPLAD